MTEAPAQVKRGPGRPRTITPDVISQAEGTAAAFAAKQTNPMLHAIPVPSALVPISHTEFTGQMRLRLNAQSASWPPPHGFGPQADNGEMFADFKNRGLVFRDKGAPDCFIPFEQVRFFRLTKP